MWDFIEAIHKVLRTDSTLVFVLVIASIFACGSGALAWLVDKSYKNSAEYIAAHEEPQLAVEWHLALPPSVMPPEQRLFMLQVWPIPEASGGGGLGEQFGQAGQSISWPVGLHVLQFTVTNYYSRAVFNVAANLRLRFIDVVLDPEHPQQKSSGSIFLSRSWPIYIPKIDPGPDHAFVFYVANFKTDVFVDVAFLSPVRGQIAQGEGAQEIGVILPTAASITMLTPFTDMTPKTKQHPAP